MARLCASFLLKQSNIHVYSVTMKMTSRAERMGVVGGVALIFVTVISVKVGA